MSLRLQRRHAGGLGRHLVVADGGEAVAEPRALDQPGRREREDGEHEHDQEQVFDVAERERSQRNLVRPDDVGAARSADEIPVDHQRLQHHGHGQGGDGEEYPAQPQRQVAHAEADDAGDDAPHQHHGREWIAAAGGAGRRRRGRGVPVDVGAELVQGHGRIGAERKERGGAEVHVAAVAAEDVPGGRQHDVLQHHVAGEEQIVVAERVRRASNEARQTPVRRGRRPRPHPAPRMPAGLTASVSSRKPKATAGAHDGP